MLHVYLIEDDPALRTSIGEVINAACDAQIVGAAETESQAVKWLIDHPAKWQLVVLDLFLKDGTGFGVLKRLAPLSRKAPVIVLTNSASPENRRHCMRLGALAVYDKTTQLEEFMGHCLRHARTVEVGPR